MPEDSALGSNKSPSPSGTSCWKHPPQQRAPAMAAALPPQPYCHLWDPGGVPIPRPDTRTTTSPGPANSRPLLLHPEAS